MGNFGLLAGQAAKRVTLSYSPDDSNITNMCSISIKNFTFFLLFRNCRNSQMVSTQTSPLPSSATSSHNRTNGGGGPTAAGARPMRFHTNTLLGVCLPFACHKRALTGDASWQSGVTCLQDSRMSVLMRIHRAHDHSSGLITVHGGASRALPFLIMSHVSSSHYFHHHG